MDADASELTPALLQTDVKVFPTDSRDVKAGDLFFAFSQPEFENNGFNGDFMDAHKFIASAYKKGGNCLCCRVEIDLTNILNS